MRAARTAVLAGAVVAALVLAPAAAAYADVPWTDPVRISGTTGDVYGPSLALGADQTTAVWTFDDGGTGVRAAVTRDHGLTWSEPVTVVSLSTYPQNVRVDDLGDLIVASWGLPSGLDQSIQLSTSSDGGVTWTPPVTAVPTPGNASAQRVVEFGGAIVLTYVAYNGLTTSVEMTRSLDDGVTWSVPTSIPTGLDQADSPQLVTTPESLVLVFRTSGLFNGIQATGSTDGITWSTPTPVSEAGEFNSSPAVAVDGSSVLATWYGGLSGTNTIQVSSSDDGGLTWSEPVDVTGTELNDAAYYPDIAAHNGSASLVWYQYDYDILAYRIHTALSSDGGATWEPSGPLTGAGSNAVNQSIAMNSSTATAIWEVSIAGGNVIQSSFNDGDGWSEPVDLTSPGGTLPSIVADEAAVIATWQFYVGPPTEVQAAARLFPAPAPAPSPALAATGWDHAGTVLLVGLALLAIGAVALRRNLRRS